MVLRRTVRISLFLGFVLFLLCSFAFGTHRYVLLERQLAAAQVAEVQAASTPATAAAQTVLRGPTPTVESSVWMSRLLYADTPSQTPIVSMIPRHAYIATGDALTIAPGFTSPLFGGSCPEHIELPDGFVADAPPCLHIERPGELKRFAYFQQAQRLVVVVVTNKVELFVLKNWQVEKTLTFFNSGQLSEPITHIGFDGDVLVATFNVHAGGGGTIVRRVPL